MEKHFLNDYVEGEQRFVSEPWYNSDGDCIEYQTADEAVVSDRIDDILTIYRSVETDKPIGFKIKGIQAILRKFGYDGLAVQLEQDGTDVKFISITTLLLAAYEEGPLNIKRRSAYSRVLVPREHNFGIPLDQILQECG